MSQSADEVLNDLRDFVAGRGREDNFFYSKVYSPSSYISSVDFSPWIGRQLIKKDIFALAVFFAHSSVSSTYGVSLSIAEDDDEVDLNEDEDFEISFESEIKRHKNRITRIIKFPFEKYFTGEFTVAKIDIIISWLLGYSRTELSRILTAYDLQLQNALHYINKYNDLKKTKLELPARLPDNVKFEEFRKEFRKLPLATRLHLFDVFSYSSSRLSENTKKTKSKPISEMTSYDTRARGIDPKESANILLQSKLISSSGEGIGHIAPEFIETISIVNEYAKNMSPAYREWDSEVSDQLSDADSVISDILDEQIDE